MYTSQINKLKISHNKRTLRRRSHKSIYIPFWIFFFSLNCLFKSHFFYFNYLLLKYNIRFTLQTANQAPRLHCHHNTKSETVNYAPRFYCHHNTKNISVSLATISPTTTHQAITQTHHINPHKPSTQAKIEKRERWVTQTQHNAPP